MLGQCVWFGKDTQAYASARCFNDSAALSWPRDWLSPFACLAISAYIASWACAFRVAVVSSAMVLPLVVGQVGCGQRGMRH